MIINKISLQKSFTVGSNNRNSTVFRKIVIQADAELDKKDDLEESYQKLSFFIERQREYENNQTSKEFIK